MASNVIGQQDGQGVFKFTNLDNSYGGASTVLLKMEEGKVSIAEREGDSVVVVDTAVGVTVNAPLILTQPVTPSTQTLAIAAGATSAELFIGASTVFITNANTSAATVTVDAGTIVGAVAHIVCTSSGTVNFGGAIYGAGGGAPQVVARGGLTLVCGSDFNWYQIGLSA
jgi:hypothetical protein